MAEGRGQPHTPSEQTSPWSPTSLPSRQATQAVVSRVPRTTPTEFKAAVDAATAAFPAWRATPLPARQRVMFRLQALIRDHTDALAACITAEQGKTLADARGDVFRGLEVVEYAAGIAPALAADYAGMITEALATAPVVEALHKMGLVPMGGTPAEFQRKITADRARWAPVIAEAGIKLDT